MGCCNIDVLFYLQGNPKMLLVTKNTVLIGSNVKVNSHLMSSFQIRNCKAIALTTRV